ncbi:hypothetical protein [Longispora albida]|uniref:hypothetical protein n=1 Tax=Longispora albida TaxID=203523 RepID=UPI000368E42C|nr:hypothetical protein [Longispora albida]
MTAELLEAGAVLTAAVPGDDTVDALTARHYEHPVLGQTFVRLVPATLGGAEDLSMEFLGFAEPARVAEVGYVRQQALGFPAWALVNDPANGHHALALVKEIERLARIARSKTGQAKEGFDELGNRLALAVPHFLPTFYEEAGRAFIASDSPTFAASMFGKAREAERAYALTIDDDRQHTVFLEFALAGALTAKALSGHARDLAARCSPADAYTRFRRLCVERTLGGLPPYAAMHTDLRRLAKAAKLDQAEADESVLAELLASPAVGQAAEAFWTAYRAPLIRIAHRDDRVKEQLLGLHAVNCADPVWLSILEECGAVDRLVAPSGVTGEPAGWLSRMAERRGARYWRRSGRCAELLDLVTRMAPRLAADAVPVVLGSGWSADLDLVDVCLASGVPVADPERDQGPLSVPRWVEDEAPGARDLAAVAADPRYTRALIAGTENAVRRGYGSADNQLVEKIAAVPGLRAAVRTWLAEFAAGLTELGLPVLDKRLERLRPIACAAGFEINPEASAAITSYDVTPSLARTLRAGVFDEWGWPAFEEAVARLGSSDNHGELHMAAQWPEMVLWRERGSVAVVAGPSGVESEHTVNIPADQRRYLWRTTMRYVDGQLLVSWDIGPERAAYWSGNPSDVFVIPDNAFSSYLTRSLAVPGGGRTSGARILLPGDQADRFTNGTVISDGVNFWVGSTTSGEEYAWVELDPATGTTGRKSMPAFFSAGVRDGEPLHRPSCDLFPAPDAADGPLGGADGLAGWRVRWVPGTGFAGEGIDGRTFVLRESPGQRHGALTGAFGFPGASEVAGLTTMQDLSGMVLVAEDGFVLGVYAIDNGQQDYAYGTPLIPQTEYWHHFRVRDAAGSAALRALTGEQATALLAGALAAKPEDDLTGLVREVLPAITHPGLVAGVSSIVRLAGRFAGTLGRYRAILAGEVEETADRHPPRPVVPAEIRDDALYSALDSVIRYCWRRDTSAAELILVASAALTAPELPAGPVELPYVDRDWLDALSLLPTAMYLAASPFTAPESRAALSGLVKLCAGTGLYAPGAQLRRVRIGMKAGSGIEVPKDGQALEDGGRRVLVLSASKGGNGDSELDTLVYSPAGETGPLALGSIQSEQVLIQGDLEADAALEFVELLAERGPLAWKQEWAEQFSEAAGVSLAEAAVLLAGLPAKADHESLGVSAAAASTALTRWPTGAARAELFAKLLPADRAALWDSGPQFAGVAAEQVAANGVRKPVSDDLIVALDKAGVCHHLRASELLHGLANPDTCRWLSAVPDPGKEEHDAMNLVVTLAATLPWLAYRLPASDPLRAVLPRAEAAVRELLARPGTKVKAGYTGKEDADKIAALSPALEIKEDGYWRPVWLRTAGLTGPDDPAISAVIAHLDPGYAIPALRAVLSGQLAGAVRFDPALAGLEGHPLDPSVSVPALVAEVVAEHGLSEDAAAVYLQLLALPDPTDRNVAAWLGWKPARLKKARAELAGTSLVTEAKRSRAGRSLFLPGGWLALKAPNLPLEAWKRPMMLSDGDGDGLFLGGVLPAVSIPELFALAWSRVRDGDGPRFDELVTGRRRK